LAIENLLARFHPLIEKRVENGRRLLASRLRVKGVLKKFWKQKGKGILGRFAAGSAKNLDCKNNVRSVFTHLQSTSHEVAET
jgi:hypothetical protein